MSKPTDTRTPIDIPTSTTEIARVLLVGASVGILTLVLSSAIAKLFIEPVFCRSADSFSVCAGGGTIAYNAALIIVSMIAVVVLVRLKIYRPLLVALGPAAGLWSLNAYIGNLPVLEYGFWALMLFALLYVLFHWLMRARNFVIALTLFIVAIIALRAIFAL